LGVSTSWRFLPDLKAALRGGFLFTIRRLGGPAQHPLVAKNPAPPSRGSRQATSRWRDSLTLAAAARRRACRGRRVCCSRPRVAPTLDLAPAGERSRPRWRVDPLRHDPLEVKRASLPEQGLALCALDVARQPQRIIPTRQVRQTLAALAERFPS
jgi:hypothetical protein